MRQYHRQAEQEIRLFFCDFARNSL